MTKLYAIHNALQVEDAHGRATVAFCHSHTWAEIIANAVNMQEELMAVLSLIVISHELSCKGEDCEISGIDTAKYLLAKAKGEV